MVKSKLSLSLLTLSLAACSASEPAKVEKKGNMVFTKSNPDGISIDASPSRSISHDGYKKIITKEDGFFVTKEIREKQVQTEEDGYLKSVQEYNQKTYKTSEVESTETSEDKSKLKPLTKEVINDDGTTTVEQPKAEYSEPENLNSGNNKEAQDLTELVSVGHENPATTNPKGFKLKTPRGSDKLKWPITGEVTERFGKNGNKSNDGINVAAPLGTPIEAAGNGKVIYVGNGVEGYGNLIIIKHEGDVMTAYSHLAEVNVKRGDAIKIGEKIGTVGQTGNVSTPQLHFSVRNGKKTVDPEVLAK